MVVSEKYGVKHSHKVFSDRGSSLKYGVKHSHKVFSDTGSSLKYGVKQSHKVFSDRGSSLKYGVKHSHKVFSDTGSSLNGLNTLSLRSSTLSTFVVVRAVCVRSTTKWTSINAATPVSFSQPKFHPGNKLSQATRMQGSVVRYGRKQIL